MSKAASKSMPSFINSRTSSGMDTVGWVSLSCMAQWAAKLERSLPRTLLYLRIISCNEALERKYCCLRRRRFPS